MSFWSWVGSVGSDLGWSGQRHRPSFEKPLVTTGGHSSKLQTWLGFLGARTLACSKRVHFKFGKQLHVVKTYLGWNVWKSRVENVGFISVFLSTFLRKPKCQQSLEWWSHIWMTLQIDPNIGTFIQYIY